MNMAYKNFRRSGAALLVVLFIVMAITILSLGFISQSDVELACGRNMVLRTQMDYLAESGLEHARGLILNPQDISEDWSGCTGQQLIADSDDYYDIEVVRVDSDPTDYCNYIIDCNSYRARGGQIIGFSSLTAQLRLDPCIALWVNTGLNVWSGLSVNGDVYCNGNVTGSVKEIGGDVYACGTIWPKTAKGSEHDNWSDPPPVDWPGINIDDFSSSYYIDSSTYASEPIDVNVVSMENFSPSSYNPAGVQYYNGDLELAGSVIITGMLVVNGNLTITGADNRITAVKNFPALLVSDDIEIINGGTLDIVGLAQISGNVTGASSAGLNVTGGLYAGGIESWPVPSITVTAGPTVAAIQTWPTAGSAYRWSPAAGAFYKSIERK